MKHRWKRSTSTVELTNDQVARLLAEPIPGDPVAAIDTSDLGLLNTVYRVTLESSRVLCLKVGQRGLARLRLEFTMARMTGPPFQGWSPASLFLWESNPITGHPCALFEWARGTRLDRQLAVLATGRLQDLAVQLAQWLARLHNTRMNGHGELQANPSAKTLTLGSPYRLDDAALRDFAANSSEGKASERLGAGVATELIAWLDAHPEELAPYAQRACLCHGDFGPENILVGDEGDTPQILDWEFALAGTPLVDLGHLLRTPFFEKARFENVVADAYRAAGGTLDTQWARRARVQDLFSWLNFLEREHLPPQVVDSARVHIIGLLES